MGQEYILQLFYLMQPRTRPSWYDFLMLHVCFRNWRSIDFKVGMLIKDDYRRIILVKDEEEDSYQIVLHVFLMQGLVPQDVLPEDFLRAIKYSDYNSVRSLKAIISFRDGTMGEPTFIHTCH